VADLRARRLEITRATLRERLVAADFDDVRVVVESLSNEFDVVDIAAAAVKLAHTAIAGEGAEEELPSPPKRDTPRDTRAAAGPRGRSPREAGPSRSRSSSPSHVRLFIGAGRRAGIRAADLVGAIANESGISSRDLGQIEIADAFSLVEVPEEMADHVIASMKRASIRGNRVTIRRDRDS
jgi:ATP-dependent RNA helicase DeaD